MKKLVPLFYMLAKLSLKILGKIDRYKQAQLIREGQEELKELYDDYEDSPLDTTHNFWD